MFTVISVLESGSMKVPIAPSRTFMNGSQHFVACSLSFSAVALSSFHSNNLVQIDDKFHHETEKELYVLLDLSSS